MTGKRLHTIQSPAVTVLNRDMQDCYTGSFPEFIPFCPDLYYFSSFKDFKQPAQA